jgi:recombinational DNA repair protein RecR
VDILSIEKSGTYRGMFHVLGGKISPGGSIKHLWEHRSIAAPWHTLTVPDRDVTIAA